MKTIKDTRSEFLGFFQQNGHEVVASSSLVPQNDPTLLFTNSGMVQFKNVFTGAETRPYTRATSSQKCLRAGGKHNDLENVGYTARHHTFFEMLGNFSFGDYFKETAIDLSWTLLTRNFGLPKDRLVVTVYHEDEEAADLWKKISGLPDSRIIRIATSDNFWSMGDTGPCGPCSEIFYDHGDHIPGGPPGSPDEDGDRFIEIWNNVFMQYEQHADGTRTPLPRQSIDTGMGLERFASILQGKHNNYDIDLMAAIIRHSADLTGVAPNGSQSASHRVIADHLRAASFLIADGVMPSNEGRGYVLRRIMRRGMRHAHLLGARDPLMYRLFPTLQSMMGEAYPELLRAGALITETLRLEETRFKTTLDRGLKILDEETATLSSGQSLSGAVAFKLYDTFGFPLDLTQDALKSKGLSVDTAVFETHMKKQREDARKSWSGTGDAFTEKLWFDLRDQVGATEFLGYDRESSEAQCLAIIKDGQSIDRATTGDTVTLLFNQTPFYAESGGQVGDTGQIHFVDGGSVTVTDTQKRAGKLFAHIGTVNGTIAKGQAAELKVDVARRLAIRVHHSVTHLLHEALRQTLGDHVAQKGSLQGADRTRFDISHSAPLTKDQIAQVEGMVNAEIWANTDVVTRVLPVEDAINSGARALFGEKYEDEVRVVSMGRTAGGNSFPFSVELCGGTHVSQTGQIGLFRLLSDSAVSSGVRRIEAIAGATALTHMAQAESRLAAVAQTLKTTPGEVEARLQALVDDRKKLEQEVTQLRRAAAANGGTSQSGSSDVRDVAGTKFTARILADLPAKDLKPLADDLKSQIGSGVVVVISTEGGKASLVVAVTSDLTGRLSAVDLVKVGAAALGGAGGGGRPDMAQAGGPNVDAANDAVIAIERALAV
ncbi:MAG: alanine--tRNA ligase [Pseudomonadota bacterium]